MLNEKNIKRAQELAGIETGHSKVLNENNVLQEDVVELFSRNYNLTYEELAKYFFDVIKRHGLDPEAQRIIRQHRR